MRLVQGPLGLFVADHSACATGGDAGPGPRGRQARDERDDDDAEDRHRRDRGCSHRQAVESGSDPGISTAGPVTKEYRMADNTILIPLQQNSLQKTKRTSATKALNIAGLATMFVTSEISWR